MFINHIYRHALATPDGLAIVNSGVEISYRRFAQMIDAARRHLIECGVPRDGVIVEITGSLMERWVMLLALRSLGHTTVSGRTWRGIEALNLGRIGAMVCAADDHAAQSTVASARPDCPIISLPRHIFAESADAIPAPVEGGIFGDHILYTSGTTGVYKKLVSSGARADDIILFNGATIGQYMSDGGFYHGTTLAPWTAGGYLGAMVPWYFGATAIFDQRPDALDHFFDYPLTMSVLLSPDLRALCERHPVRPADSPRWNAVTGGGFLNADLAVQVSRQLGCDLQLSYAGTEFRQVLERRIETEEDVVWLTLLEGRGFEIVDEDDVAVSRGEEGIVRIRSGPTDPTEYLDDPEATARHFRGGYFYPGDMAVQREDGRVRILGRIADVLTVGAQKMAVGPLEENARRFLGVATLCMFVRQSDDGTEELLVVIEGDNMPADGKIRAMLASTSKLFAQTRFSLLAKFPRGDNGMMKVNRREVLRLATEAIPAPPIG